MSDSEDYTVERLLKIKKVAATKKYCGIQVFIKWKDYADSQNTWEPIENLNPGSAITMLDELNEDAKGVVQKALIKQAIEFFRSISQNDDSRSSEDSSDSSDSESKESSKHAKNTKKQTKPSTKNTKNDKSQAKEKLSKTKETPRPNDAQISKQPPNPRVASPSPQKPTISSRDLAAQDGPMIITEESEGDVHDANHNGSSTIVADYKIGKKQHDLLYTQIFRKQPNLDSYMVTKAKIDPISKSVLQVESVDFMDEFAKSLDKKQLLQLCLSHMAKTEDNFSKLAQKNFRTFLQSK